MRATRREFIKLSAVAGANVPLGERPSFLFTEQTVKPLRILLLGGTGFTELLIRFAARSAADTLAWVQVTPTRSAIKNALGRYAEREAEVLAAWKKQKM
jgi:hypothetical protein